MLAKYGPQWASHIPWGRCAAAVPVGSAPSVVYEGYVVHRDGQFGPSSYDWVEGVKLDEQFHKGIDIIGVIDSSMRHRPLRPTDHCLAPRHGVVHFVGLDYDGVLSVIIRHSAMGHHRMRFSLFADLREALVEEEWSVAAGDSIGRPVQLRQGFFFHFALGYRVFSARRQADYFVDPTTVIFGSGAVRDSSWFG